MTNCSCLLCVTVAGRSEVYRVNGDTGLRRYWSEMFESITLVVLDRWKGKMPCKHMLNSQPLPVLSHSQVRVGVYEVVLCIPYRVQCMQVTHDTSQYTTSIHVWGRWEMMWKRATRGNSVHCYLQVGLVLVRALFVLSLSQTLTFNWTILN